MIRCRCRRWSGRRRRAGSAPWSGGDDLAHTRGYAVPLELVLEEAEDARILVAVFDLPSALLDVDVHADEGLALVQGRRIAHAAEGGREVPRRLAARVEVLVEEPVGWREDR